MGSPLERQNGNRFVLVVTYSYSKLTKAVSIFTTMAQHITSHFMDNWITPYGILMHVLRNYATRFVNKFFQSLSAFLGLRHLRSTVYHLQLNGHEERSSKTIFATLRHNVTEQQQEWYIYLQLLTWAYSTPVRHSTNLTLLFLVQFQHPLAQVLLMPQWRYRMVPQRLHSLLYHEYDCYTA